MREQTINAKKDIVSDIENKIKDAESVIFVDYRGLSVLEVSELRNNFRGAGVEYRVMKNTMIQRAVDNLGIAGLEDVLKGPTAVAFGAKDPVAPAKIMSDFIKKAKKTEIKGGILAGRALDPAGVKELADLPSKEQLLAKMMGSLNAPVTGFVMVLSGVLSKFVRTLEAVRVEKEKQN